MKFYRKALAFISGFINGTFASGGGILAVDFFTKKKIPQKNAQATALCSTMIMTVFSMIYYLYKGYFAFSDALVYIPFGIPGALCGSYLLNKIPDRFLRKVFAGFIIWAGVRMMIK